MSMWNYVVTALKPTSVTHSCVGNVTGPLDLNLIIAKCTRIEIHQFTGQSLQLMLDLPMYGRIATLELLRPPGETRDLLFITTERYKFCLLQWDVDASVLITRAMGDVWDHNVLPRKYGQIAIIDPECRLIGLHLYDGLFKVISPYDDWKLLKEPFNIKLKECQVLDIKFLYGCQRPTIVVLYEVTKVKFDNVEVARHIKTYEVVLKDKCFWEGPWSRSDLDKGASLLIPVRMPPGGVIIVGEETIVYISGNFMISVPIEPMVTKAYGRVDADGSRYLLGDHSGFLYLLDIIHEKDKVTNLKVKLLGETSIASTISYLGNDYVFVGSSYGDSQLVALNLQPDAKGSCFNVLKRYDNLGPIVDFCVVDLDGQGSQVVTCSGAYKDGSLRVVRNGIRINKMASIELQGIKGIWSLRSSTEDTFDSFLVVSFIFRTLIFAMNEDNSELQEIEIDGFNHQTQTLFCKDAIHNQLVQVTSDSVRLVNSSTGELSEEWNVPHEWSINVAKANSSQVLLAAGGGLLVYLEIGDGVFREVKHAMLESDISCLDISPIGDNPIYSEIAAVGMWKDTSVQIFCLPSLKQKTKVDLGGGIIARSVLLCLFEGVPYLLCGLGDGHLFKFQLDVSTGEFNYRERLSLGTQEISLQTFSSEGTTHVFAASDRPTVIYSSNEKLVYSNVNVKNVSNVCSFNTADLSDSIAIAMEGELAIGTIDDIQKVHIRSISFGDVVYRIAHQKQSRTFAICSYNFSSSTNSDVVQEHFIHLLDDQKFGRISNHPLEASERACSIISCSFDDDNMYYCVGTSYFLEEEKEPSKGRILVFRVQGRELRLIAGKETEGAVYSLTSFNCKLLAAINHKIQLYRWVLWDDGSLELQTECEHDSHNLALYVQTRDDIIFVGDFMNSVSLLMYQPEERTIVELAHDFNPNWITAVEILDNNIYLAAEGNFNLLALTTNEERSRFEVVGEYHLGEFINHFRHGSLVPDSEYQIRTKDEIRTVIFGTVNGVIGIVASLPHEQYLFFEKLQDHLTKVIKGVGELSHEEWRSFNNEQKTSDAKNFLDGDLIELLLDLSTEMISIVSKSMDVSAEQLVQRVKELSRLLH